MWNEEDIPIPFDEDMEGAEALAERMKKWGLEKAEPADANAVGAEGVNEDTEYINPLAAVEKIIARQKEAERKLAEDNKFLRDNIEWLLGYRELSARDLERYAGVSAGYTNKITNPSSKFVMKAAEFFGVSMDALVNTDMTERTKLTEHFTISLLNNIVELTKGGELLWEELKDSDISGLGVEHPLAEYADIGSMEDGPYMTYYPLRYADLGRIAKDAAVYRLKYDGGEMYLIPVDYRGIINKGVIPFDVPARGCESSNDKMWYDLLVLDENGRHPVCASVELFGGVRDTLEMLYQAIEEAPSKASKFEVEEKLYANIDDDDEYDSLFGSYGIHKEYKDYLDKLPQGDTNDEPDAPTGQV